MAIALASGFDFIRCEGFVFGHLADEGYIDSCAGNLLRFRKAIGADKIQIYCDLKKKHRYDRQFITLRTLSSTITLLMKNAAVNVFSSAHAITSDVSLGETAKAAQFFLADGVVLTGLATRDPAVPSDITGISIFK